MCIRDRCLGAWVARAEVADVALPMLFDRLEGLRLIDDAPAEMSGWVFRGMTKLPVAWDRVRAAARNGSLGEGIQAGRGSAPTSNNAPQTGEATAVSYTHLDLRGDRRQQCRRCTCDRESRSEMLEAAADTTLELPAIASGCLLYTSRCV